MFDKFTWCVFSAFFLIVAAQVALAQDPRVVQLSFDGTGNVQIIEDAIVGDETVDYIVRADRSEIISVDLQATNSSAYFNILSAEGADAVLSVVT